MVLKIAKAALSWGRLETDDVGLGAHLQEFALDNIVWTIVVQYRLGPYLERFQKYSLLRGVKRKLAAIPDLLSAATTVHYVVVVSNNSFLFWDEQDGKLNIFLPREYAASFSYLNVNFRELLLGKNCAG